MKYLLDTNICVFVIRQKSQLVLQRLRQHQAGDVGISTVTLAELRYGADKSNDSPRNNAALDAFLVPLETVEFSVDAADEYGHVRSDLERRGLSIGPLDNLIAAHARSLGVTLVTNNVREFSRVTGL
ncbi:MAG: type II toxin-antitoxin system VapC family toxin, partial [Planctomycetia bacterium]|nr:type II toxin-antitoxin system VapC family toxin [Planctomycetia bacterium]